MAASYHGVRIQSSRYKPEYKSMFLNFKKIRTKMCPTTCTHNWFVLNIVQYRISSFQEHKIFIKTAVIQMDYQQPGYYDLFQQVGIAYLILYGKLDVNYIDKINLYILSANSTLEIPLSSLETQCYENTEQNYSSLPAAQSMISQQNNRNELINSICSTYFCTI